MLRGEASDANRRLLGSTWGMVVGSSVLHVSHALLGVPVLTSILTAALPQLWIPLHLVANLACTGVFLWLVWSPQGAR